MWKKTDSETNRPGAPAITPPTQRPATAPVKSSSAPAAAPGRDVSRGNSGAAGGNPRAVIGMSIVINGEVSGEEDLLIQGRVIGEIKLPVNSIVVGNDGQLQANIAAKNVEVEGAVKGEIVASERILIRKSGRVEGNVTAPRVVLEDGCRFQGSVTMREHASAQPAPAASPQPAQSSSTSKPRPSTTPSSAVSDSSSKSPTATTDSPSPKAASSKP
ncbi:polymer-forming cytoskeletal protein [Gammaproteobacteria bacterium]|nr:polymer-forming cytoskeletal protein [Gammaproteobacteria bacterium]